MNPFNGPSRPRDDEELVSPRGTVFRANYDALISNSSTAQSTGRPNQHDIGQPADSQNLLYHPLHGFTRRRQLTYTGSLLGKRRTNSDLDPPPHSKRFRRNSNLEVPNIIPFAEPLAQDPDRPPHNRTQNIYLDYFSRTRMSHQMFFADPFLSQLPLDPVRFDTFIRPSDNKPGEWARTFGYGNDWPSGGMPYLHPGTIHPVLRQLCGPGFLDPWTQKVFWNSHDELPELWRALTLASQLLSNTHSLAFFHKILFEEPQILEAETRFYGRPVYQLPTNTPVDTEGLTEDQRIRVVDTLCTLADHIDMSFAQPIGSFTPTDIPAIWARTAISTNIDKVDLPKTLTSTSPRRPSFSDKDLQQRGATSAHMAQLGFRGTNAIIELNPAFKPFLEADATPFRTDTSRSPPFYERQYALFFLAVTVVKQIARAAWLCRMPAQYNVFPPSEDGSERQEAIERDAWDPFVGNMRRTDLGAAWERSVFGGTVVVCAQEQMQLRGPQQADEPGTYGRTSSGHAFAMGLAVKEWPDAEEKMVHDAKYYPSAPVPLARVLDAGGMMEVDVENENENGSIASRTRAAKKTMKPLIRLPVVQSADRWESLRVMPFWFVAQFFQAGMWKWANGGAAEGGEGSTFRRWIELEVQRWPLAVRENPRWGMYLGKGAKPADFDTELELIQMEVDAESDDSDEL